MLNIRIRHCINYLRKSVKINVWKLSITGDFENIRPNQQKCDILSHKLYKLYLLHTQVVNTIQGIKSFLYRLLLLYKDRIILQDEGRRTIREH